MSKALQIALVFGLCLLNIDAQCGGGCSGMMGGMSMSGMGSSCCCCPPPPQPVQLMLCCPPKPCCCPPPPQPVQLMLCCPPKQDCCCPQPMQIQMQCCPEPPKCCCDQPKPSCCQLMLIPTGQEVMMPCPKPCCCCPQMSGGMNMGCGGMMGKRRRRSIYGNGGLYERMMKVSPNAFGSANTRAKFAKAMAARAYGSARCVPCTCAPSPEQMASPLSRMLNPKFLIH